MQVGASELFRGSHLHFSGYKSAQAQEWQWKGGGTRDYVCAQGGPRSVRVYSVTILFYMVRITCGYIFVCSFFLNLILDSINNHLKKHFIYLYILERERVGEGERVRNIDVREK